MARLPIRKEALRDLGIASKNQCAFPGCDHPILNEKGEYIAELCHIEAAEPGGSRFNPKQSDEDRRSPTNLLLLCHRHHKETDDVNVYTVARLQKMKDDHARLPAVVFNNELLLQKLQEVLQEQARLSEFVQSQTTSVPKASSNFAIYEPSVRDGWTPEAGRYYESETPVGTKFKLMMRDGWLHIEQTLADGAVAYYEVNEKGSVRNSRMPYPINEYHVEIPDILVLSKEQIPSNRGTHAVRTTLKWSVGDVTEHFQGALLIHVDCNAPLTIDHNTRTIQVLLPKGA